MKFEQINENTFKVMIETADLEERGISFFDLLGSQKKIESFFYDILDEVGVKHEFEGIDAVTFQVVPKPDGLDLYITKGMAENVQEFLGDATQRVHRETMGSDNPLDQVIELLEKNMRPKSATKKAVSANAVYRTFVFEDFKNLVAAVKHVDQQFPESMLYHYENQYYMTYKRPSQDELYYAFLEFGHESVLSPLFLSEYGEVISEKNALNLIDKYFK